MKLALATFDDVNSVLAIMDMARAYQRSLGFKQWEDDYPNRAIIEADILSGNAYIFTLNNQIVGYAVLPIGDSAYDSMINTWIYEGRYGVVHRLALNDYIRGKGYSSILFELIEDYFNSQGIYLIRIDTGEENKVMQRIMDSCGYQTRGVRTFPWGKRIAYEKNLKTYD